MSRLVLLLALLLPAAAVARPPVTPPPDHPRLLLRPADLPAARAARTDPALAASWAELRRRAYLPDDYRPQPRYDVAVMLAAEATAFLALVEDDAAGKRRAIALAFQLLGDAGPDRTAKYHFLQTVGRCLMVVAEVYDWCHDALQPDERERLCQLLREHASIMEIKFPPTTPNALAGHSSENQLLRDQLAMAIATYDEDPGIWDAVAGRFYREFTSPRDFHYAGHFHHQGNSYGLGRFNSDMWAALLLERMGAPAPWSLGAMSQVPYYFLYLRRPDGGLIKEGDDFLGDTRPSGSYWASAAEHWFNYVALFRDPQFAAQWRRQLGRVETKYAINQESANPVLTILTRPDLVPSASLTELPLARYFPEPLGAIIARTGWDIGPGSRDAVAYLKINTHRFDNHQHADSGQFQLFYRGSLAIDSGLYQSSTGQYGSAHFRNYFRRAVAHNTLLIDDPSETFEFNGDPIVNDGGQRALEGAWTMEEFWQQPSRTARVLARHLGPHPGRPEVSLIKGDLTAAYSPNKACRVTRTMAFLPLDRPDAPAALIVLDRVESVRSDQRKAALLHTIEEPLVDGPVTTITRTGGQIELLRWEPTRIRRDHEYASEAEIEFNLASLDGQTIAKAELSVRSPWSLEGDVEVWAGDRRLASVPLASANPDPLPDVTDWINALRAASDGSRATLTVRRVGGDSRGVVATPEGPYAPHLRLWVEAEPYGGKLVQTTVLPAPEDLDVVKLGGPGREFVAGGQNWPAPPKIPEPMASNEGGAWRVEISARSNAAAVQFLNVYQVMDTTTAPLPVRRLDGPGLVGVAFAGRAFLASATDGPIAAGAAFELLPEDASSDGQVLVVLTDLAAGDHSLWQGDALRAMAAVEPGSHTWVTRLLPGGYELKSR